MPARVIALFLAAVLLWSGLGSIEGLRVFASSAPADPHNLVAAGAPPAVPEGSVEHHHLDDLPSQAQTDPPAETPALMPATLVPPAPAPAQTRPRGRLSAAAGPPFLAGPLRPPCSAALAV